MRRVCTNCGFDNAEATWFEAPFAEAPDCAEAPACAHEWGFEMEAELPSHIRLQ